MKERRIFASPHKLPELFLFFLKKLARFPNSVPNASVREAILLAATDVVMCRAGGRITSGQLDGLVQFVAHRNEKASGLDSGQLCNGNAVQGLKDLKQHQPVAPAVLPGLRIQWVTFRRLHSTHGEISISRERRCHTDQPCGLLVPALLFTALFKMMLQEHNAEGAPNRDQRRDRLGQRQPICSVECRHA